MARVRGIDLHPYMVQDWADLSAVGDEGVDAHLPPANCGTTGGGELVDSCNQHRPQTVRSMLGWCMFGRESNWIDKQQGAVCAAARGSYLGRRTDRRWPTQARPQMLGNGLVGQRPLDVARAVELWFCARLPAPMKMGMQWRAWRCA